MDRSHPATGLVVALVVALLLVLAGWPRAARAPEDPREWRLDEIGLRMLRPPGWSEFRDGGSARLVREPERPLEGTIAVRLEPDLLDRGPAARLVEERATLARSPFWSLDGVEVRDCGGRELVRLDFHGVPPGAAEPVRCARVLCDLGGTVVVVEACASEAAWPDVAGSIDAALDGIAFE